MKVKNGQVPGITMALNEIVQKPVDVRTGMKIRKLVRIIEQQTADVEAERQRLIEKHALRDTEGKKIIREDRTFAVDDAFFVEIAELMALEFEAEPLTVAELDAAGSLTPATLIALGDLLVEADE